MLDILALITGKKRKTASGWYSFNGVCCHHRGHAADRRMRGGIIFANEKDWSYHCFNCGYKCGITTGKHFSKNTKQLLEWLNQDTDLIDKWSFQSFSQRMPDSRHVKFQPREINFDFVPLPPGSEPIDINDPDHTVYTEYLKTRGLSPQDYPFHVSPGESGRNSQRIIIPYYYQGKLVGNTSRYYDNRTPKYISEQQRGYVFNIDAQSPEWSVCILVEGQFDAISIGGCAYLGSTISDEQSELLSRLKRKIIVVPDRDKSGLSVCERAIELGYQVSIPNWHDQVKDVNDAVKRYGRFATLLSILESATTSRIIVEMQRKKLL